MAVLTALPDASTIANLKGKIDFYLWKGIPVARQWPKEPEIPPDSPCRKSATDFGQLTKNATGTDPLLKQLWATEVGDFGWSWRDALTSAIYQHANLEG